MALTPYHAKYFAYNLTGRAVGGMERLSMSLFGAEVYLDPQANLKRIDTAPPSKYQ